MSGVRGFVRRWDVVCRVRLIEQATYAMYCHGNDLDGGKQMWYISKTEVLLTVH